MFRPCIDLRAGRVTQIVGGTLGNEDAGVRVNFVTERPAAWYAALYRADGLRGGHIIQLGPGNEAAACSALAAYPGGLQLGGGVTVDNASRWLDAGASQVIVTSWVFPEGRFDPDRLEALTRVVGRDRLVLDLSCRWRDGAYRVVAERWTRETTLVLDADTLGRLGRWCAEFLVHAADIEGLCEGIDIRLVERLAEGTPIPVTYAGGARSLADLETVTRIGRGRVDLTIGSALDLFGGTGVRYADCVAFNRQQSAASSGTGGTAGG